MSSRIWIGFLALIITGLAFGQSADFPEQPREGLAQPADRYAADDAKDGTSWVSFNMESGPAAEFKPDHKPPAGGKTDAPSAKTEPSSETEKPPEADNPLAPNWMLPDLQGNQVSLYQEANQGRMTVMVFWATWCRNCKILLPKINDLKDRAGDLPVAFYLLNIWEDGDPLVYVEKHDLKMQVILRADHVAKRFDVGTTPGVVVVDANRHIIYQRPNGISMDEVVSDLEQVLGISTATQRQ